MTWLLNQLHKVFSVLTGRRRSSNASAASASNQLERDMPSRPQQSELADVDAPTVIRLQRKPSEDASDDDRSSVQSAAPLRQEDSSVLKDVADPVAEEPDTHRRLDATAASTTGDIPAAPSFPTHVSELLSVPATLKAPDVDQSPALADELSVPEVEPSAEEQLPEIHDLLPAVEPGQPVDTVSSPTIGDPSIDAPLPTPVESTMSMTSVPAAADSEEDNDRLPTEGDSVVDSLIIEPAQRVSSPSADQVTLFSFDVVENDTAVENSAVEIEQYSSADSESADSLSAETVTEERAIALPETTLEERDLVDISQRNDSQTDSGEPAPVSVPDAENPWLRAKAQKSAIATEELSTKSGVVKLLFKLKPGNFHGYIEPDDGSKDILFHQKYIHNAEIFDAIERGDQVSVVAKQMAGKAYATRVDLLRE